MNALAQAVAARFPRAVLVDQDATHAYIATGERGISRLSFTIQPSGQIRLGASERMRPATTADRLAAIDHDIREVALALGMRPPGSAPPPWSDRDFAAFSDHAFEGPPRPVHRSPPVAGPGGLRLHNLTHVGDADDFAEMPRSPYDPPARAAGNPDYCEVPVPTWERQR